VQQLGLKQLPGLVVLFQGEQLPGGGQRIVETFQLAQQHGFAQQ